MNSHSQTAISSEVVQRLAGYIPLTVARQILDDDLSPPGIPRPVQAAALFSDISGFTAMSEELAKDGPRGAEELNRVLLLTFTAMIDLIHGMGGAVTHFYGDAMAVYFPDSDGTAAHRALVCAQQMQQMMLARFGKVITHRSLGRSAEFQLTMKVGVGYGPCHELVVGDVAESLEFVLLGKAVDEAALAEKHAESGEVVASQAVLQQAGLRAEKPFVVLTEKLLAPPPVPPIDWSHYDEAALFRLANSVRLFVSPALYERLVVADLPNLAEHRPVTSMFIQFVFLDEGETAVIGQRLQQYYEWARQVIERFGSRNARLNRVLTGDKGNQLHIMFGAPVAPDAPEQAIRCALALQREQPEYIVSQHIGLAAGKVFAGPVGAASRSEYTVVGDVVNLSARLAQICQPGGVVTDPGTADRVDEWIDFNVLPAINLKGKQIAVQPHYALGDKPSLTQLQAYFSRWSLPLVGRDAELAQLLAIMDDVLHGNTRAVAITGTTGSGKTRLLAAGVKHWLESRGIGLVGVCHQHTNEIPFGPWRSIWRDFFHLRADMSLTEQAASVVKRTHSLLPDIGDDVGLWADTLGLPIPLPPDFEALTAEARQSRFFQLVRGCLRAASQEQPLLLILENIHWADQVSLNLIDEVTRDVEDLQLLTVMLFRPRESIQFDTLKRPNCAMIPVNDISPQHARELLTYFLGTAKLPDIVEQYLGLRDRDGRESLVNPLFLEEALNMMISSGVLQVNGEVSVNEALLDQVQIPDTIHGLLLARLDRLPVASRDLLQIASVIGREFGLESLDALTTQPPRPLKVDLLHNLSSAKMTQLVSDDPEWVYLFQHAMTHEVAYESLPYVRRQTLHASVADWIEQRYHDTLRPYFPMLAYHFDRADMHEKCMHYALAAAEDARDIYANNEAVDLYTMAEKHLQILGAAAVWETAVDLYLNRARVQVVVGALQAGMRDAEQALQLVANRDATAVARACNIKAEICYRQGKFDQAEQLALQVIKELGDTADVADAAELIRAYTWASWVASSKLDFDLALQRLQIAETLSRKTENNYRLALALEAKGFVYFGQNKLAEALLAMQQSVALSRNFSTPVNVGFTLSNIAFLQCTLGQHRNALPVFDEAVENGRAVSLTLLVVALANRASALAYLGQYEAAAIDFEEADSLIARAGNPRLQVELNLFWGFDYHCPLHNWEAARRHFEKVAAITAPQPENYPEEHAKLLLGQGQVALATGSAAEALLLWQQANDLIAAKNLDWLQPAVAYYLAQLAAEDDGRAALDYLEQAKTAVLDGGNPDYLPLIYLKEAQLVDNQARKIAALRQCVQTARKRARYADRITCLREAGERLIQFEDPALRQLGQSCLVEIENGAIYSGGKRGTTP